MLLPSPLLDPTKIFSLRDADRSGNSTGILRLRSPSFPLSFLLSFLLNAPVISRYFYIDIDSGVARKVYDFFSPRYYVKETRSGQRKTGGCRNNFRKHDTIQLIDSSFFNHRGMLYNLRKGKIRAIENERVTSFSSPSVFQRPPCT